MNRRTTAARAFLRAVVPPPRKAREFISPIAMVLDDLLLYVRFSCETGVTARACFDYDRLGRADVPHSAHRDASHRIETRVGDRYE